jgi:hypothetical protein
MAAGLSSPRRQNERGNRRADRKTEKRATNQAIRKIVPKRRCGVLQQRRECTRGEQIDAHLDKFHSVLRPMKTQTFGRIQPGILLAGHSKPVLVQPPCQKEKLAGAESVRCKSLCRSELLKNVFERLGRRATNPGRISVSDDPSPRQSLALNTSARSDLRL